MDAELAFNWQITGHERQRGLLERALGAGRLAHAYVFAGPAQSGKRTVAKRLAQFLLCESGKACGNCMQCKNFTVGSNADYLEISGDGAIKIEAIRDLSYKMSLKPYSGRHKIAVIDDSHNMTIEAANGLLKILEEPKPLTMMILVTHNPHRLLPTILSRSQKISFGPLANGPFNISQDARTQEQESQESFNRFILNSVGERLVLALELAEQETPGLKKTLDHWLGYLQTSLRQDPAPNTVTRIKGLMRAQRLLDQNVNPKLLLSELMIASN
jgi:DNA polymerase III delta prime subunit